MGITLEKMTSNTSEVMVTWGEDVVNVTYRPGKVTEKLMTQMAGLEHTDEKTLGPRMTAFNKTLAGILVSWDVLEGKAMFPMDYQRFPELPLMFRMQVAYAVMSDIRPENLAPQVKTSN
jgi:hypothetical protein